MWGGHTLAEERMDEKNCGYASGISEENVHLVMQYLFIYCHRRVSDPSK